MGNRDRRNYVALILDGLSILKNAEMDDLLDLRWFLMRGSVLGVPVIVTCDTETALDNPGLVEMFRTRVYGNILGFDYATILGANPEVVTSLKPFEFTIREGDHWTNFVVPSTQSEE